MKISEQIIEVIETLCDKFGVAIDWTSENVIPYIEILCGKLITYEIATSITWIVLMVLLSIGSIIATKKLTPVFKRGIEQSRSWDADWDIGAGFAIAGLIILNLIVVVAIVTQVMDILKCITFPEMYVFEYVNTLVGAN